MGSACRTVGLQRRAWFSIWSRWGAVSGVWMDLIRGTCFSKATYSAISVVPMVFERRVRMGSARCASVSTGLALSRIPMGSTVEKRKCSALRPILSTWTDSALSMTLMSPAFEIRVSSARQSNAFAVTCSALFRTPIGSTPACGLSPLRKCVYSDGLSTLYYSNGLRPRCVGGLRSLRRCAYKTSLSPLYITDHARPRWTGGPSRPRMCFFKTDSAHSMLSMIFTLRAPVVFCDRANVSTRTGSVLSAIRIGYVLGVQKDAEFHPRASPRTSSAFFQG